MTLLGTIQRRIRELEKSLELELRDGADPDGYNVGWLQGAIYELRRLVPSRELGTLVEQDGDWVCPSCGIWIEPTELGCGCGRMRPSDR